MYKVINFGQPTEQKGLYLYEGKFYVSDGIEIFEIGDATSVTDGSKVAEKELDKDDVFYLGSKSVEILQAQGKGNTIVPISLVVKIEQSKDFNIEDQSVQITTGTQLLGEFKNIKNGVFLIKISENQVKMTENTPIYVKLSKNQDPVSGIAKLYFKIIYKVIQWNT